MEEPRNALEPRKLYRSETQRMVAGVCGGLADYFNIDATVLGIGDRDLPRDVDPRS